MRASGGCFSQPLTVRVLCFLSTSLEKSRSFRALLALGTWLEASFRASALRRAAGGIASLYPGRLWGWFDRASGRLEFALSPPAVVGIAYVAFLAAGSASGLSPASYLLVAAYLLAFGAAYRICSGVRIREVVFDAESLRLGGVLMLASVLALCADLYRAGAVPLIEPAARMKLSVPLTYASTFLVPAGLILGARVCEGYRRGTLGRGEARMYLLALGACTVFLITLLGFRTQTAVGVLSFLILMRIYRLVGNAEILAALLALLGAVGAIGAYRLASGGGEAGLWEVVGGRAQLTVAVYDQLVRQLQEAGGLLTGYYGGRLALSTFSSFLGFVPGPGLGARTAVAMEFGVTGISMTSTLLGTVVLDLGLVGVVLFGLATGAAVGSGKAISSSPLGAALYSILLAYMLTGIETGLVDFSVLLLFAAAPALALCSAWRCRG